MRIAVTGAGGRIGSQVVELLAAGEGHQVVALARAVADYADPDALRAALRGVDTLVFVSSDGPVATAIVHHHNVITAAADCGIGHIVALSALDADLGSPFCYAVSCGYTEQLLHASGCPLSIARASIFSEFFTDFLTTARRGGRLRLPAADGRISLVSRRDVGRCLAALALASPTGRCHQITGPRSLDMAEVAATAEQEWRTPIEYSEITPAEYCVELARAGEDPWWVYAYSTMFDSVRRQRWASVTDDSQQLTGRPPIALREVLAAEH